MTNYEYLIYCFFITGTFCKRISIDYDKNALGVIDTNLKDCVFRESLGMYEYIGMVKKDQQVCSRLAAQSPVYQFRNFGGLRHYIVKITSYSEQWVVVVNP